MDIKICNRILIKSFNYKLMKINLTECSFCLPNRIKCTQIRVANISGRQLNYGKGCGYAIEYLKYVRKYDNKIADLLFWDGLDAIGYAYVFLKGTQDKIVKVQNAKAYLSQFEVFSEFRGRGYSTDMLHHIMHMLKKQGINDLYLACRPDNDIALKLYENIGFEETKRILYTRVLGINIPQQII